MSEQNLTSSDVELTSLMGRNDGSCADDDVAPLAKNKIPTGKEATPLCSGFSGGDVLIFLLSVVSGIVVVAALVFGVDHIKLSNGTSSAVADDEYTSYVETSWRFMRWHPILTGDNCLPRFQLANSTIHCGVGGLSPLNTSSGGTKYCGGVKMEPNDCVLPLEGGWAVPSPSQIDESIPPLPRRFGINDSNVGTKDSNVLQRCKTMEDFINGTFEGSGSDQEWVPETCSAVPLSPFAWTQNAACQTTITMMGDSHVRNTFTATVNGLRGIESFTEAHADDAGKGRGIAETYEWRLNNDGSATDRVAVHADTNTNEPIFFEDCPCDEVKRCLRIIFIWAPMFNEQLSQMHFVQKWKSNLVIVEPGNSYESSTVLSSEWTAKFDELLQEDEHLQLGILHFMWGNQPIKERGDALTEWTTNGTYHNRKSYLQQSAILKSDGLQSRRTFHFACGLGKVEFWNDNINAAEPCTDVTDTAQIRALITVHFDALLEKAERSL